MRRITQLGVLIVLCFTLLLFPGCRKRYEVPAPPEAAMSADSGEPAPAEPRQTGEDFALTPDAITSQLKPVFFDFDKSEIRADQEAALQTNARILSQNTHVRLVLEGHCDERGTEEYNLALGDRRAKVTKEYLTRLGVDESRIDIITYGESRPFAYEHNEKAWQQNRRAQPVAVRAN